jgi:tetratricopeptide (TPR) repeat protein
MQALLAIALLAAGARTPTEQAEQLAQRAVAEASAGPAQCVVDARKALELTADFEPTAYVTAGRKGEVVEDAYLAARAEFRKHRSRLYAAMGACQAASGRQAAAARYLGRAVTLDPAGGSAVALARSLVALGRGREAVEVLLAGAPGGDLSADARAVANEAADLAGLPSLQVEIDRVRLAALPIDPKPEVRDGPLEVPDHAGLSSGVALQFKDDGLWLLYVPKPDCRTCSGDLEVLKSLQPPGSQVVLVPPGPDEDQALRGVANLYRYRWPFAAGPPLAPVLKVPAPAVMVVARRGFLMVVVPSPFTVTLPGVMEVLAHHDVQETVPRAQWNRRRVDRRPPAPKAHVPAGELAPGEDEPAPPEFVAAQQAYRAGKPAEALRLVEALAAREDGWLLSPEARYDRALCLAALGRREEARRLLLRTGDSRFQDDVDRALEDVGSKKGR